MSTIQLTVYGAVEKCASCVHLPSALETKEWLEAAIRRKFSNEIIHYGYCDIEEPKSEEERKFSEAILADKYFYPLVVLNGKVVAEGNPNLKKIYSEVEKIMAEK